jgi:hypothetical protein
VLTSRCQWVSAVGIKVPSLTGSGLNGLQRSSVPEFYQSKVGQALLELN